MSLGADYAAFERALARALLAPDPKAELRALGEDRGLPEDLRALVRGASPIGFELSALLVAKLRFERLLQGSPVAGEEFERDPRAFSQEFKRYHREEPPTALGPAEEAKAFLAWRALRDGTA